MSKIELTKRLLYDLYISNNTSAYKISKQTGWDTATVIIHLKKHGIKTRNRSKAALVRPPTSISTKEKMSKSRKGKRIGKNNPHWKGGRNRNNNGYILIKVYNHPYSDKSGYIYEHRLVMEKELGRYLKPEEVVHHINNISDDNRIENLMLFKNSSNHMKYGKHEKVINRKIKEVV